MLLVLKVLGEGFAEAMADAAFLTFLSSLCAPGYSATQYALLSSAAALPLRTLGSLSGVLAQGLGWVPFYAVTIFAALPAMLIMVLLVRRPEPPASPRPLLEHAVRLSAAAAAADAALEHGQVVPAVRGVFRQHEPAARHDAAADHQVLEQAEILDLQPGGVTGRPRCRAAGGRAWHGPPRPSRSRTPDGPSARPKPTS